MILLVDIANVMGSRPDGWWRDRVGAARRLLDELASLPGREIVGPDGSPDTIDQVVAVVEGRATRVEHPDAEGLHVVRAARDGDSAVVEEAQRLTEPTLVVTADRGLRARLPAKCAITGPRWLLDVLAG